MSSRTRPRLLRARILTLAVAVTTLLAACGWGSAGHVEVGSGDVVSQTRSVAGFTEVKAGGGIQLQLATGPQQLVVTAQPNIADITTTEVSGSRLTVDTRTGFVSPDGIVVKVTAPRFTAVDLSGGASAAGSVGSATTLKVGMSGGARTTLGGTARTLNLQASGGAIPALGDLPVTDATVDLSGGVVATLDVSGTVRGTASGGVVLTLTRKPSTTSVETSGGAVVNTP